MSALLKRCLEDARKVGESHKDVIMDGALKDEQELIRQDERIPSRGHSTGKCLDHCFLEKSRSSPRCE